MRQVCLRFDKKKKRCRFKFANCGRKRWVMTEPVQKFVIRHLLKIRKQTVCTSKTLQAAVARDLKVTVSDSAIRKLLKLKGYKWRPRAQKRKYSAKEMKVRKQFVDKVLRMTKAQLDEWFSFSMDGIILTRAPTDPIDRANYCRQGDTHMYRKAGERAMADLAGAEAYSGQVPMDRVVPLWGGIALGGAQCVLFHEKRKLKAVDWAKCVRSGKLSDAVKSLKPVRKRRPWRVLCDNEKFLKAKVSLEAYKAKGLKMEFVPPRSPDLNPIERFWSWLRRALRKRDLEDLMQKRPLLGRTAFKARVRAIIRSQKAREVAKNYVRGFRKVCQTVSKKKGAHSGK